MSFEKLSRFAATLALGLAVASCDVVFGLERPPTMEPPLPPPNALFAGCFTGPVQEPAGTPPITVIFIAGADPPGTQFTGCGLLQGQPESASTIVGNVRDARPFEADVTFMRMDGIQVNVTATHDGNTGTPSHMTLTNAEPRFTALNLDRCATALTCADLGVATP